MNDVLIGVGVVAVWVVLQLFILPKLGLPG